MLKISRRDMLRYLLAASAAPFIPVHADQSAEACPLIIDSHIDLGWNIINFERDYTRSAYDIRADEAGTFSELLSGKATLGLPEWQAARVALIFGYIKDFYNRVRRYSALDYLRPHDYEMQFLKQTCTLKFMGCCSAGYCSDVSQGFQCWLSQGAVAFQLLQGD